MSKLPLFEFEGSAEQIGKQQGKMLKDEIFKTIEFYKTSFNRPDEEILHLAEKFKKPIKELNIDFVIEIEAIANEIDVDPLWIYALNARSEIMNKFQLDQDINECTAFYFPGTRILAQNWDWAIEMEDLAYIAKLKQSDDKPDILMMTEPGIIGKIGMNSYGLGVLLNFLHIDGYDPSNVPTHILMRAALETESIIDTKNLLESHSSGRTSNLLIGDDKGNYFDIEYAGDSHFSFSGSDDIFFHTNHFLGKEINTDPVEYASSFARYDRTYELVETLIDQDLDSAKDILLDSDNKTLPICRPWAPSTSGFLNDVGTICSIIMDLRAKEMHITRGNPIDNEFELILL